MKKKGYDHGIGKRFWIFIIMVLIASTGVLARTPRGITNDEMALLPKYCPYTQGFKLSSTFDNPSPAVRQWVAMMGKDFWHMHHHCWALIHFARSSRASIPLSSKRASLTEARDDFLYVVQNASAEFVLLPEVLTWLGRTAALLGNDKEAIDSFQKSIEVKPDYWPAYFHWATLVSKNKSNTSDAIKIVRDGLSQAPDIKALQALYRDLGGKVADLPPPPISKGEDANGKVTDNADN